MEQSELRQAMEAVLFVADEPLPAGDLAQLLEVPVSRIEAELALLGAAYEERRSGLVLRRAAGGFRLATHPDTAPWLERFVSEQKAGRLTQAALETLAIVAYRQPVSRGQIAEIRGVSPDSALRTLVARALVQEVGRDPGPGQAILYGTTPLLLERLGLDSVEDLPPLVGFMPDASSMERMEAGLGPGI
jgi:segregation and condensation protein B